MRGNIDSAYETDQEYIYLMSPLPAAYWQKNINPSFLI